MRSFYMGEVRVLSMSVALESLHDFLSNNFPDTPGTQFIDISVSLNDACDLLTWLCHQPIWPQFYWQQRNGDEEVAALSAVRRFTSLLEAQHFLQQSTIAPDLRIWGLNAFVPEQGALFLPRFEWRRCVGKASMRLILSSDISLHQDAKQVREILSMLYYPCGSLPELSLLLKSERHHPDRAGWFQLITQATDAIASGKLDKVVLARATDLCFSQPLSAGAIIAASRRVNLSCYHFYMAFDQNNAFLGSSPERLWWRQGNLLRTEALAGTVANHPEERQAQYLANWLMHDDKNQRENMLVVEDICQRLRDHVQSLEVQPPQVVRLRKVQHLRRCIWTTLLASGDDVCCLQQLQPTAAVAGLPRNIARQFIEDNEPFIREWYAGSAGYLSCERSEFCVALRSGKVTGDSLRLYVGAGVVRGSDPEQEWQEINNKAAGLRSLVLNESNVTDSY